MEKRRSGEAEVAGTANTRRASRPRKGHTIMSPHKAKSTVMGITFSTQNCAQAGSQSPRPLPHMNLNVTERLISSELRGAGFNLQEVIPPELESAARLGRRTRGAGLRQLEGVGRKRFVLSSDDDNELRSRCE